MRQRELFLREAIAAHLAYDGATATLRQLFAEGKGEGSPEWLEAFARQQQSLEAWSALQLKFGDFYSDD